MKNIFVILFALIFNINKCNAQKPELITEINTLISKVDKGFSVDTTSYIDSVQIDNLNNLYFAMGIYIDASDGDANRYGKIYVLKYDSYQFSVIDSTARFEYDYYTKIEHEVSKDSLFINFEAKNISNSYAYVFNRHLQIYQLVNFGGSYTSSHYTNDKDGSSLRLILNSNYDIKKQLLLWEITEIENENNKKSGKKKIILPKDFPVQLRQFDILFGESDGSILIPPEWYK